MKAAANILIVDDDSSILEVLDARLSASDFMVFKAGDAASAVSILKKEPIDLLVSDVKMPHKSGMDLFTDIQTILPDLPVIFLTAYGTIPDAVDAIKQGVVDYISKPFDGRMLINKINETLSSSRINSEKKYPGSFEDDYFWGNSRAMKALYLLVCKVSSSDVNVLILGESGVGKECIAKYIHQNSPRNQEPCVVVDCGSTPAGILESELFGHTKGSFTHAVKDKKGLIQAADKGTLFLDEIGNISHDMQCRLLRFLEDRKIRQVGAIQEKSIDCRILAATNADLTESIEAGIFRQDLYYRLKGITLTIPPLRERKEDIPALSTYFVDTYTRAHGIEQTRISQATMKVLMEHDWPGNIRELKNAVEAGTILCRNHTINPWDLQLENIRESSTMVSEHQDGFSPDEFSIEESEKKTIIRALKKSRGVQKKAADLLSISKRAIHYKVKKYDIQPLEYK